MAESLPLLPSHTHHFPEVLQPALPDNVLICWTEPLQGHQLIFGSWTHLFQEGQFQFSVTLTSPLLNFEDWDKKALVLTVQLWPPVPWVSTEAFYIYCPFRERGGKHVPWKLGHHQPFPHPFHRKSACPPVLCCLCPVIPEPQLIWSIWVTWPRTTWSGRTNQRLTNNLVVAPWKTKRSSSELKHMGRIFQYVVRGKARCSKKKVMGSSYARDTWKDTEILGNTRKGHPGKNNGSRLIRFF